MFVVDVDGICGISFKHSITELPCLSSALHDYVLSVLDDGDPDLVLGPLRNGTGPK